MRLLTWFVVILFAAVGLGLLLRYQPGYVMIHYLGWTVETSLVVFAVVLGFIVMLIQQTVFYLLYLWRLPYRTRLAYRRQQLRRSQRLFQQALTAFAEGRWADAEQGFVKSARHSRSPLLHHIGATWAAQRQRAVERCEGYLDQAEQSSDDTPLLIDLTRAELQLTNNNIDRAIPLLEKLHDQHPRHPRIIELLMRCYASQGNWQSLLPLLPLADKYTLLESDHRQQLRLQAYRAKLAHTARHGSLDELHKTWKQRPAPIKDSEPLLIDYVGYLHQQQADDEAQVLLRDALKQHWSESLVLGFGELEHSDTDKTLMTVERWLEQHPNDPQLLLTAARLTRQAHRFSAARDYLERSINLHPTPESYRELGELLDVMGEPDTARQTYRAGLALLAEEGNRDRQRVLPAPRSDSPVILRKADD